MRSSTSQFDQPIPLSKIRAFLDAWYAVRDDMPLEEFLERQKCIYESQYRRSHYPLPFDAVIEDGAVKKIANSASKVFWQQARDPTGEDMGVPIQTELEREEIARKLEGIAAEIARLNHERHQVNDQVEALDDEEIEAIRRGEVLSPKTKRGASRGRRRPRLPVPWVPVLGYTSIVSMTVFEGCQLGLPYLDSIGVDTTNLAREWVRNPIGIVSGAGFAVASSVGLFLLWHLVLRHAGLLSKSWQSEGPVLTALRVGGIFGLCCVLLVGTYLLANMRHVLSGDVLSILQIPQGQQSGAGIGQSVFLFLTLLVPFAAAYLHRQIEQSAYWLRRRDITLKQAQWDQENEERVIATERLADRRNLLQQKRDEIEHQHTLLQNQLQALAQRAQAAQRQQLARLEAARRATKVYARSLLAALQQDRYYFIRLAHRYKADHLVPEQVRRHTNDQSQPPLPFVHPLLPAAHNGQST
jgi:hypothetical protein